MSYKFNGICLVTHDVPRLRQFYAAVLGVKAEGDDTFVALSTRGAELYIFSAEGMERMTPGSMAGAGHGSYAVEFEVEDVDREYARLQGLGVTFVKPPTTHMWGQRSVWFRDPDGNIIDFHMKAP
jgi:catechol 2,3-dioxygenase-like lactoylglutathione lyase family enzyme